MLVLGTTALAAGSLGGLVALWRDKTFQALAMTVLFLVLYLCLVQASRSLAPRLRVDRFPPRRRMAATLDPFSALARSSIRRKDAPALRQARFAIAMLRCPRCLNGIGIVMLRVWNPSGEPIMQREVVRRQAERTGPHPRGAGEGAAGVGQSDSLARDRHAGVRPAAALGEDRRISWCSGWFAITRCS